MRFKYTNGDDPDFKGLCQALDRFLHRTAGEKVNQSQYDAFNQLGSIHDVVLAYEDEIPVGCAGFKRYDDQSAELKRVFVREEYRGKGIAGKMLENLEEEAGKKGYSYLILETGKHLTAAIALYKNHGYAVIPNYGPYKEISTSVCMGKKIKQR